MVAYCQEELDLIKSNKVGLQLLDFFMNYDIDSVC